MTENTRKTVLIAEVDATGAKKGFEEVKQGARDMAQAVTKAGQDTAQGLSGVGAAAEQLTAKQSRLVESIRRQAVVATEGKAAYLAQRAAMEGVSSQTDQFIAKLREAEKGQVNLGNSAKQTAFALRGVPAQFTDIITALQGGQAPMTVLLQQGGQLKDMFGGIGPAARALGGYIGGLINPFTLTAAAIGAFAIAAKQGSEELRAFQNAATITGNAIGVSASQFSVLRDSITGIGATKGKAAEVLTEIAQKGNIAGSAIKDVAEAAILMERATGTATTKTISQFAELAKSPVEAAAKLNEQYNFLTAAVFRQIKALDDQGRATDAANLAEETYAKALKDRAQTVLDNAGLIEKAWRGITGAAKGAWDAMLNVGRDLTPADNLAKAAADVARIQAQIAGVGSFAITGGGAAVGGTSAARKAALEDDLKTAQSALVEARRRVEIEQRNTAEKAEQNRLAQLGIAWTQQSDDLATKSQKMERELTKARIEGQQLVAAGIIKESELQQRLNNIREKYKESGAAATGENAVAAAKARGQALDAELKRLQDIISGASPLNTPVPTPAQDRVRVLQQELLTSVKGTARANLEAELAQTELNVAKEKDVQLSKLQVEALKKVREEQERQVATVTNEAENIRAKAVAQEFANASLGKSQVAMENAALAQMKLSAAQLEGTDRSDPKYLAALYLKIDAQERFVKALKDAQYAELVKTQTEQARANDETAKTLQLEVSLAGQTAEVRAVILARRQAEVALAKEIAAIDKLDIAPELKAERKAKATALAQEAGALDAQKKLIEINQRTADQLNQSLTDALLRGFESGKTFAENFRDTLKNMFSTLILRPIIQATLAPVSGAISGTINSALGLGNSGGGINSLANLGSKAADFFGFGSTAASTGVESLGFGAAELSGAGVTASSVGVGGGLASIGAVVPYVAAAFAAAQLLGLFDHGGPKVSGSAGTYPGSDPNSNALDGLANQNILGTKEEFKKLAVTFGATAAQANAAAFGLYVSTDPQGKSATLLGSNASVNGKQVFDSFDTNVGRSQEELQAAFAAVATRQILAALKATDLDAATTAFLAPLDAAAGDIKTLTAALDTLEKARTAANVLEAFGVTLSKFTELNIDGQAALLNVFGGAEAFQSAFASYQKSFYSADEQLAAQRVALQKEFDKLGLALPGTKEEFRALVSGLDITTDAGQQTLASLIKVSGAFAQVSDAAKSAADDAIAAAKASADANATALKNAAGTAFDILKASIAAQKQSVEDAFSAASTAAQGNIDRLAPTVDGLQSLSDSLRSTLNSMTLGGAVSDAQTRKDAQRQIVEALGLAKSGKADQIDQAKLSTALATAAKPNQAQFSDFISYARDYAKTVGDISMLAGVTDDQLSVQKRQLQTANDTLAQLKKQHDQDIAALTSIQDKAQAQIDAINGTTVAVKTVADALKAFASAVKVVTTPTTPTTTTPSTSTGSGTSTAGFDPTLVKAAWDANPSAFREVYQSAVGHGQTSIEVDDIFQVAHGTALAQALKLGLPGFANGLLQVPYDNFTARLHKDELVMPARQATEFRELDFSKFQRNDAALVAEMRATREEIEKFRMNSEKQTREHIAEARKVSRVLVGAENTTGGGGLITVAAA